jgi:hypothetical protein
MAFRDSPVSAAASVGVDIFMRIIIPCLGINFVSSIRVKKEYGVKKVPESLPEVGVLENSQVESSRKDLLGP